MAKRAVFLALLLVILVVVLTACFPDRIDPGEGAPWERGFCGPHNLGRGIDVISGTCPDSDDSVRIEAYCGIGVSISGWRIVFSYEEFSRQIGSCPGEDSYTPPPPPTVSLSSPKPLYPTVVPAAYAQPPVSQAQVQPSGFILGQRVDYDTACPPTADPKTERELYTNQVRAYQNCLLRPIGYLIPGIGIRPGVCYPDSKEAYSYYGVDEEVSTPYNTVLRWFFVSTPCDGTPRP